MSIDQKAEEIKASPSYTPLKELPDIYLNAVVAVEDKRFYKHPGIDAIAIGRAIKNNIHARQLIEGGSTITQQLAKNMYFTQERSLIRKVAEGFMAIALERKFSKDEILELYVNSIYFGDGYYLSLIHIWFYAADGKNGNRIHAPEHRLPAAGKK